MKLTSAATPGRRPRRGSAPQQHVHDRQRERDLSERQRRAEIRRAQRAGERARQRRTRRGSAAGRRPRANAWARVARRAPPRRRAGSSERARGWLMCSRRAALERGDERCRVELRVLRCEQLLGRAAPAERAQAALAVLVHVVGQRVGTPRAQATLAGVRRSRGARARAAISSSTPCGGDSEETATTLVERGAQRAQRGAHVAPGARGDLSEVGLRHDEHVRGSP